MNRLDCAHDSVRSAVEALRDGKLVVLPTETVYGIAARADSFRVVCRLLNAKRRPENHPFTIAVPNVDAILRYVPDLGESCVRLLRATLPGPVTYVLATLESGAILAIPPEVRRFVRQGGYVGFRVPDLTFTRDVLREVDLPVVLTSANLSGMADTTTGSGVVRELGDVVDLIFDGGTCRLGRASTVVQIPGDAGAPYRILREGALPAAAFSSAWNEAPRTAP